MKSIRIGNDIAVQWRVMLKGGEAYNLEGKSLTLYISTLGGTKEVNEFAVNGNVLTWVFRGREQRHTGACTLTLIENRGQDGMLTVDVCEPFKLVSRSCMTDNGNTCGNISVETVEVESSIDITKIKPIIPEIGDNGNWWIEGKDTGVRAEGRDGTFAYPIFSIDPNTGILKAVAPYFYEGDEFMINNEGYLTMKI